MKIYIVEKLTSRNIEEREENNPDIKYNTQTCVSNSVK